jgi:hypothetical protein
MSSSSPPQSLTPPFFPTYQSPPQPPSPPFLATFPANISSLLLPTPHTKTHNHRSAAVLLISLSLFSILLLTLSAFFAYHRRHHNHKTSSTTANDDTASRSDSLRLFPPNTATSDSVDSKPSSGSEIFHLGTISSSENIKVTAESSCNGNVGFSPSYRNLTDSPELRPLPPLPRHNVRTSKNQPKKEEHIAREDEEQFHSPKVSPSAATSSHFDKFGSKSLTSRTSSYPLSRSPSLNLSPIESINSFPPQSSASPSFSASSSPMQREDLDGKNVQVSKLSAPAPAPPPLPPRFWETPVVATQDVNVDVRIENEESSKPKLKALHWDKVKASSDRAMVWDHLRPSSFQ